MSIYFPFLLKPISAMSAQVGERPAVLDRIDAAHRFLSSLQRSRGLAAAKALQLQSLVDVIGAATLSLEEGASANSKFLEFVLWNQDEQEKLLAVVLARIGEAPASAGPAAGKRTSLQNYMNLMLYMPSSLWDELGCNNPGASLSKLIALMSHCINLGLRTPSEGTMQTACAIYLLCHEGQDAFDCMTPAVRMNNYKAIKQSFKRMCAHSPDPPTFLQNLPARQSDLQSQAPSLWRIAFPGDCMPELSSRIDLVQLQRSLACIPMRLSRADVVSSSNNRQQGEMLGLGPNMQMMQQFAQGMAQQLQQVTNVQQQMLQAMQGHHVALPAALQAVTPAKDCLMLTDLTTPEGRFMKRANSKLALLGDVSLQSMPLPSPLPAGGEAPSGEAPSTNAVAEDQLPPQKEEPKDKKKKTVTEAADLMIAAMDRKNPPPKATAKSKCQPTKETKPFKQENTKLKVQGNTKKQSVGHKPKETKKESTDVVKNPHFGHEASRDQFMCRTGISGPGQTTAIQYDPKKPGSMAAAKAKAEKWLKAERKKRGIPLQ